MINTNELSYIITVVNRQAVLSYIDEIFGSKFDRYATYNTIEDKGTSIYFRLKNGMSINIILHNTEENIYVQIRNKYTDKKSIWNSAYPINTNLKYILDDVKRVAEVSEYE